jgi:hypothetical protein
MHLHSPHGDQGFPGSEGVHGKIGHSRQFRHNTHHTALALPPLFHPQGSINAEVVYTLTDDNYFLMEMAASLADDSLEKRPTPLNLTNHTYFNLAGHAGGASTVDDHMLHMESERYVRAMGVHCKLEPTFLLRGHTPTVIPSCPLLPTTRVLLADAAGGITGVEAPVEGTPHDFRSGASLGGAIAGIETMQPRWPHGDAYLTSNQSKVADYESLTVQDAASELNQWSKL